MTFGTWGSQKGRGVLNFTSSLEECPICFTSNCEAFSFPNCDHYVCIPCFKRKVWGKSSNPMYLQGSPYDDEVLEEYYSSDDEKKSDLVTNYPLLPLIALIERLIEELSDRIEAGESSYISSKCPMCRA